MDVNSLPKTVTRQRRDCDLNPLGYRATRPSGALSDTAIRPSVCSSVCPTHGAAS